MSDDYSPEDLLGTGRYLSKADLRMWTRFLDAGRLLEEILAQHVAREHGITHSDYEVLVRLDGAAGEMRMSTLAKEVVSSAQKLTHTANRLEHRGWITRTPVDDDGRGLMAVLTDDGREALAAAAEEHAALIKRFLLDAVTPAERKTITGVMDRAAIHMRVHRRKEPCEICGTTGDEPI